MTWLRALWSRLTDALITDDPNPSYSRLDRADGLNSRTHQGDPR